MIDWFPPASPDRRDEDAARLLARWRTGLHLRRVARAVDARHPATGGHSRRVADVAARVARVLGWREGSVRLLREAGLLHDVGLACLPDEVLEASAPLDPEDWELVRAHAAMGAAVTAVALGEAQVAWVRHHHERWDGDGYPDGLSRLAIPSGAAILGAVEAWDAMIHGVRDRRALSPTAALGELRRQAGCQFSPWVVRALDLVVAAGPPQWPAARRATSSRYS